MSSREWMLVRLQMYEDECRARLGKLELKKGRGEGSDGKERAGVDSGGGDDKDGEGDEDDEDDREEAERTLDIVMRLKLLVDRIFPVDQSDEEPSVIFHHNLSNYNVLIDDDGALTGLPDWECVSAVPLWQACSFPDFLVERPREGEPKRVAYDLNDEDSAEDYWRYNKEYEVTKLRRVFLDEMARLEPEWVGIFNANQPKRELDEAVVNCDSEFTARSICYWSDDVLAGRDNMLTSEDRRYGCYGPNESKDDIIVD